MFLDYRKLNSEHKLQIIAAFSQGMECRDIPNYLNVSERCVSRVLKEAGINTNWRIYSRKNIEVFYNFVYQHPNLGLQRKKSKIEEILRSYKRD